MEVQDQWVALGKSLKGPVFGTAVHTRFANKIKAFHKWDGVFDVRAEESQIGTKDAYHGQKGSSRADVTVRDRNGKLLMVIDLKTGGAKLTNKQIDKYEKNFGPGVEIYQLGTDGSLPARKR